MSITIAGDIYTVQERAKAQGYLASVWGIASVVGPTLGGVFSQFVSWRWIFYVNVPICILAAIMIIRALKENDRTDGAPRRLPRRRPHHGRDVAAHSRGARGRRGLGVGCADQRRARSLSAGCSWSHSFSLRRRAAEPILPLWVFSRRLLGIHVVCEPSGSERSSSGCRRMCRPISRDRSASPPIVAGLALAALTVGWPLSASQAGRFYLRIGFRNTALIGLVFAIAWIGVARDLRARAIHRGRRRLLLRHRTRDGPGRGSDTGRGPVERRVEERGVVTGANLFFRSIGSAVGVAIFGAIANALVVSSGTSPTARSTVISSSTAVFAAVAIVVIATVGGALAMPRSRVAAAAGATAAPATAAAPTGQAVAEPVAD